MDPTALAGMIFVLLMVAMVGGFILLLPISRRLAQLMEERLTDRKQTLASPDEIRELRAAVRSLRDRVEEVVERQEFTERLLSERHDAPLPAPRDPDAPTPST